MALVAPMHMCVPARTHAHTHTHMCAPPLFQENGEHNKQQTYFSRWCMYWVFVGEEHRAKQFRTKKADKNLE
jgi:hypothetical protein